MDFTKNWYELIDTQSNPRVRYLARLTEDNFFVLEATDEGGKEHTPYYTQSQSKLEAKMAALAQVAIGIGWAAYDRSVDPDE